MAHLSTNPGEPPGSRPEPNRGSAPTYRVTTGGMGQPNHYDFATLAEAERWFGEWVEVLETYYGRPAEWTCGRFEKRERRAGDPGTEGWTPDRLRRVEVQNVKKRGRLGAYCNFVELSRLGDPPAGGVRC